MFTSDCLIPDRFPVGIRVVPEQYRSGFCINCGCRIDYGNKKLKVT